MILILGWRNLAPTPFNPAPAMFTRLSLWIVLVRLLATAGTAAAPTITFVKQRLDTRFYAEGVAVADVNRDGHPDVIAGPYWWEGPDFTKKHEMRAPLAYNPESYSDAFIMGADDFDHDGWTDILQIGWPGREALWFKNPGPAGGDWARHVALSPAVGTESPAIARLGRAIWPPGPGVSPQRRNSAGRSPTPIIHRQPGNSIQSPRRGSGSVTRTVSVWATSTVTAGPM